MGISYSRFCLGFIVQGLRFRQRIVNVKTRSGGHLIRRICAQWLAQVSATTRSPEQLKCKQLLRRARHAPLLSPSSPLARPQSHLPFLESPKASAEGREEGVAASSVAKPLNGEMVGGREEELLVGDAAHALQGLPDPSKSSACLQPKSTGRPTAGFWARVETQMRCVGLLSAPVQAIL